MTVAASGTEPLALEPRERFDAAILGVAKRYTSEFLVYSEAHVLRILEQDGDDDDTELEAREHFEYNILGGWVGEGTPAFIVPWREPPVEVFRTRVDGSPVPQGSKRVWVKDGRAMMAEDQGTRHASWRREVTAAVVEGMVKAGVDQLEGPVSVLLTFFIYRPANHYGTGRNSRQVRGAAPPYPSRAPDIDKLTRAVLDAMTDARLWADDGQVTSITARKRWTDRFVGEPDGCEIVVGRQ